MTVRAKFTGDCRRCPVLITPGDQVIRRENDYIHASCASGQDDDPKLTPKKKAKPYRSGFCARSNPKVSHKRCPGDYRGRPCVCDCHGPELVDLPLGQQVVKGTGGSGDEAATAPPESPASIPDDPTGLHDGLDEELYHSHAGSLSQSGAKLILKAPALYRWEQDHRTTKRAYDLGHYAHAKVLGVGAEVVALLRTDTKTGAQTEATDFRPPSVGAHADEIHAAGKIPLLRKEIEQVDEMADVLSSHRMAMRLLSDGRPEVSAFGIDEETGVMRRARFDWLGSTILSDYKTADSSHPEAFLRSAINFGYHIQHPWYLQLAAELGHDAAAFAFIVQEKKPPYLVTVIELPPELVNKGAQQMRVALQRFRDCTESGLWPGYVPDDTFAQPAAPAWALREEEYAS